ncbi:MAG: elongation factor G, partial [Alphaproteobacteria bacterium]|nr:elongation factor G [Alphaproteobacteria bacterium]
MADGGNGPRCAAIVGTYLSGKTSLMEAMLYSAGAISRKGNVKDANMVGDPSNVSKARSMSTEINTADCQFMGDQWTLLDCPGSVEFAQDPRNALAVADIAIVVCDPDPTKAQSLAPLLKYLDDAGTPHMLFINKADHLTGDTSEIMAALQAVSERPLALRHMVIRDGETITGYVDLLAERAYTYKAGDASDRIDVPGTLSDDVELARQELLETLADFNDDMLEKLLEETVPEPSEIYRNLREIVAADQVVPVLIGSGENQAGVFRLWKALRHDAPGAAATAERIGVDTSAAPVARVCKTYNSYQVGKISLARIWAGSVKEGDTLGGERVGGLYALTGQAQDKKASAGAGEVVGLSRMDAVRTGDLLTASSREAAGWAAALSPVYSIAVHAEKREDEVKLAGAIQKLVEEDHSYILDHNQDTHEMVLLGQGEIHLAVAIDNLKDRYKIAVGRAKPAVPYKETIKKPVEQHARHKKQSGGHGQFGDVKIEIKPLPRGSGFEFEDKIVGGSIPKQFIPSVHNGVKDYLASGPLGFPVVDIHVRLFDGQFHAVDSSDMAFKTAAATAMREGMPKCGPVLLEPIDKIHIDVPSEHTSKVNTLITGRRGQILGFDTKEGW